MQSTLSQQQSSLWRTAITQATYTQSSTTCSVRQLRTCTGPNTLGPCAEATSLHDVLEQLEPISARHGLAEAAGMKDLICQHKEVQQQIAEAKQRVARLQLVEEVERRQHSYESWLEHGTTATEMRLDSLTELCCMFV